MYTFLALLLASLAQTGGPQTPPPPGIWWGVDDAGGPPRLETIAWAPRAFRDLGVNLWIKHSQRYPTVAEKIAGIERVDRFCMENDLHWISNLEGANWLKTFVDDKGRDWYNRPDGRHFELMPDDVLEAYGRSARLLGIMYDEPAHMQNCRNMIANNQTPLAPWIYDPGGESLEQAADRFASAVREIADIHARHGLTLYTEHVFPILFHGFARGGWTPGAKVLKEGWSPVYIATLLGACVQYDKPLWLTPDLWHASKYPGHSVETYRSSLLLAYHMGAYGIYTENLAHDQNKAGKGSLILVTGDDYELTDYGRATGSFIRDYVPGHPRGYSALDVRPRVAIVRQPDACWGQKGSWLGDRLFGNDAWSSTPVTEGWLKVWHLLTLGVVPEAGISWWATYREWGPNRIHKPPYRLLCPVDGVVVYDHHVRSEHLRDTELIFLTGLGISPGGIEAVAARVREGATCIAMPHLVPDSIRRAGGEDAPVPDGRGQWLVTDDFLSTPVREAVAPYLPEPDTIHYRFGDMDVTFRAVDGDPNRLRVDMTRSTDSDPGR